MPNNPTHELPEMSIKETTELRDRLTKELVTMRREKAMRIPVYLAAKHRDAYEIAKKWAYKRKLTKKPTDWAFAKFAIKNTIEIILNEMERERNAPPEVPEEPDIPQEPNMA